MSALDGLRGPDSHGFTLRTLTPLYTGGVGQRGEHLHPSGILGSIRHFSCLLANALGDPGFAERVWGRAGDAQHMPRAKAIGLRIDPSGLKSRTPVPGNGGITWTAADGHHHRGWFYNSMQDGPIAVTLTPRGISETDLNVLLTALRIQFARATIGAKDQFGLGVVEVDGDFPSVGRLCSVGASQPPSLQGSFFAEIRYSCAAPTTIRDRLECGLRWRAHLRRTLAGAGWSTNLRHYVFGYVNESQSGSRQEYGSAVSVSAVYRLGPEHSALRVWGVLPHTTAPGPLAGQRPRVVNALRNALIVGPSDPGPCPPCGYSLEWTDAADCGDDVANWLNTVAGSAT